MSTFQQLYTVVIDKLEHGLPAYLTYHNVQHTRNVVEAATYLAEQEHLSDKDKLLVQTAALFHDTGFLQSHEEHEMLSCKMAQKLLPGYGFIQGEVDQICTMIMATKLPQSAGDMLSRILCDADLYYLGTDTYDTMASALYSEMKRFHRVKDEREWLIKQIDFLNDHKYYTDTAKKNMEQGKQNNKAALQEKLNQTINPISEQGSLMQLVQDASFMILGVLFAGVALKGFLVPNHFFDGGVTGISLLVHEIYHYNLAVLIIVFNIPLMVAGYFSVGKRFAIRMLAGVLLLGICLELLPSFALTADKLLISIFGGAFLGIGIGLVMRVGAALDGIEVIALYTLKRTSFTITEIILGINILIFSIAAFQFGIETALYSILTYFTATRCIDYVVEGIQAYTGVTIISSKSEVIKYQLVNKLGRGITVYKGERGFLPGKFEESADCDIIFTVVTRLELRKLKNLVHEVDPKAFVFANTIRETSGGILKRKSAH
jgi:uncharacterized membrane-anchored protein YitT (DUF2179 family)/HD superfamily phosphodiesterase